MKTIKATHSDNLKEITSAINSSILPADYMFSEGELEVIHVEKIINHPLKDLYFITDDSGGVAGYMITKSNGDSGEISHNLKIIALGVLPKERRKGYAKSMVKGLIESLKNSIVSSVSLEVLSLNMGAIRLYESLGFTRTGSLKNYFKRNGQFCDMVIMQKMLDN